MPSYSNSLKTLNPERWKPLPVQGPVPVFNPNPVSVLPPHLSQNPKMLSSLPAITTSVTTGSINQFYGGRKLPSRQVILPG